MAPFPIWNPFMISSAAMSSTWAAYSIGAAAAALVVIAALAEGDADDEAIDEAANTWREANSELKSFKDKFPTESTPPVTSWSGTNDRTQFDTVIDQLSAELESIVATFENNAKALDDAKDFYNKAVMLIFGIILAATVILVSLMALKATLFGAPAAEAAQTATAWSAFAAVVGVLGSLIGLWSAYSSYAEGSAEVKFKTDVDDGERGGDIEFEDITIDWGSARETNPVLN